MEGEEKESRGREEVKGVISQAELYEKTLAAVEKGSFG
jgi:hypothetical protein